MALVLSRAIHQSVTIYNHIPHSAARTLTNGDQTSNSSTNNIEQWTKMLFACFASFPILMRWNFQFWGGFSSCFNLSMYVNLVFQKSATSVLREVNSWNSSHYLHLSAQPRCWGGGCWGLIKSHLETPDYTLINKIRLPRDEDVWIFVSSQGQMCWTGDSGVPQYRFHCRRQ